MLGFGAIAAHGPGLCSLRGKRNPTEAVALLFGQVPPFVPGGFGAFDLVWFDLFYRIHLLPFSHADSVSACTLLFRAEEVHVAAGITAEGGLAEAGRRNRRRLAAVGGRKKASLAERSRRSAASGSLFIPGVRQKFRHICEARRFRPAY
jgi:hypothetical protein